MYWTLVIHHSFSLERLCVICYQFALHHISGGTVCNISIIDDSIAETAERFQVNIFSPGALINTPSVSVIINDNDGNLQCHLP